MGADVSRVRFDPLRDFAGVVLQQGRLLLDGDFNEHVALLDRRLRAETGDLTSFGPILVAKSTGTASSFAVGARVFHQKFGNGNVTAVDGNKLTIHFDKAGEKRVVDSFVERV